MKNLNQLFEEVLNEVKDDGDKPILKMGQKVKVIDEFQGPAFYQEGVISKARRAGDFHGSGRSYFDWRYKVDFFTIDFDNGLYYDQLEVIE